MQAVSPAHIELAKRLRWLRVEKWPDVRLTQSGLAGALSEEDPLSSVTVSSWENLVSPKLPPRRRLLAYARFFSTRRSIEAAPKLLPLESLTDEERIICNQLEAELLELRTAAVRTPESNEIAAARSWHFQDNGPMTLVCAQLPNSSAMPVSDYGDPNYTELLSYADLDAMVELHGHIRAENPRMTVSFKTSDRIDPEDLAGHVILLGGIEWDYTTKPLSQMIGFPIRQEDDPSEKFGRVFVAKSGHKDMRFLPRWKDDRKTELVEDIGLLARVPNPLNTNRTLTICKGLHSRGALGAARILTDVQVRQSNEQYILDNFGEDGCFAIIMSVPIISGKAMSPDLNAPGNVLYKWSPQP
jgi:hypothetical protein